MIRRGAPPDGYLRLDLPHASAVVRAEHAMALRHLLGAGAGTTLHDWAASTPDARPLRGRGVAWSAALPGGAGRLVVRHNRHGGLLAGLTGDRFLAPTRAPYELDVALRLAAAGVETPEVIAYVLYPASPFGVLARSDVATREVPRAHDLGAVLTTLAADDPVRRAAIGASAALVNALSRAGARHHDLNVKNVLLTGTADDPRALVLDVDRVTFHRPGDRRVQAANVARLLRSIRKYERLRGVAITPEEISILGTQ